MLDDAQRAMFADMRLPKPLQDMLDENIVDSRLPDYYINNLPDYDALTSPVNELRNHLESDLAAVAQEPDPIARKHLLLGVAETLRRGKLRLIEMQAPLIDPFIKMDVFLQLTTAIEEDYRHALLATVEATKRHTHDFMNGLLSKLEADMERKMIKIEKQICRQLLVRKAKHLFGITP
jgi:hypothetical protein